MWDINSFVNFWGMAPRVYGFPLMSDITTLRRDLFNATGVRVGEYHNGASATLGPMLNAGEIIVVSFEKEKAPI